MVKVSCGARHSAVVTADGDALHCGCNKHGEMGEPADIEQLSHFTSMRSSTNVQEAAKQTGRVKDLECGWWHTVVLAEERQ